MFLRIPLPVDDIRQRKKAKSATTTAISTEETWVEDCPFLYVKDGHHSPDENIDDIDTAFSEVNSNSLDELIIMPKSDESYNDIVVDESITPPGNTSQSSFEGTSLEEPEQKLSVVISGMQQVLEQSQECLKSLQKQKEQQKQQIQSDVSLSINAEVSMIQKVHILLDGLNLPNRTLAERRIVQFLCECQIKTLNNVDIDDVDGTEDY